MGEEVRLGNESLYEKEECPFLALVLGPIASGAHTFCGAANLRNDGWHGTGS